MGRILQRYSANVQYFLYQDRITIFHYGIRFSKNDPAIGIRIAKAITMPIIPKSALVNKS